MLWPLTIMSLLTMVGVAAFAARYWGVLSLQALAAFGYLAGFAWRFHFIADGNTMVFSKVPLTTDMQDTILFLAVFAQIATVLGFLIVGRAEAPAGQATAPLHRPGRLLLAFVGVVGVQVYELTSRFGGTSSALDALSSRSFAAAESIGFAANLTFISLPLGLLAFAAAGRAGQRGMRLAALLGIVAVLPLVAVVNGRAYVITALWALAVVAYQTHGRLRWPWLLAGGVTAVAATVVGLAWRQTAQDGVPFRESLDDALEAPDRVLSDALPLVDHFAVGYAYADTHLPDYGLSLLNGLVAWVPRSIWPDKPEFWPQILGEQIGRSQLSGLPAGLLGEGWIAAGAAGVLVFALVFGIAVGGVQRFITARPGAPMAVFAIFLGANIVVGGLRTGAQGAVITTVIALIVAALPVWVIGRWALTAPRAVRNERDDAVTRRLREFAATTAHKSEKAP